MKFMIPFLMAAVLPVAGLAQSQSGGGSGVPSIAIPKTTEVIVIETPRQGVTPQQVVAVIPEKNKATGKLFLHGEKPPWCSRRGCERGGFFVDAKNQDEAGA